MTGIINDVVGLIKENPISSAIGAGVIGAGAGLGTAAVIGAVTKGKTTKSATKRKRITHTRRGWSQDRRLRSKQKWELAYQRKKRKKNRHSKKRSKRRSGKVYKTKNGQPYILMKSGKARFIKRR